VRARLTVRLLATPRAAKPSSILVQVPGSGTVYIMMTVKVSEILPEATSPTKLMTSSLALADDVKGLRRKGRD
jgi:hypothetical protein